MNAQGDDPCRDLTETTVTTDILRNVLPSLQPQEGSPANTFTESEFQKLQAVMPNLTLRPPETQTKDDAKLLNICERWERPERPYSLERKGATLNWYGAPTFSHPDILVTRTFRQRVRSGEFTGPTNGVCPGMLQCNLVVLPQGPIAFDFFYFVKEILKLVPCSKYVTLVRLFLPCWLPPRIYELIVRIYRSGKLHEERNDVRDIWPENSVAFLIGCSFSYDGALQKAGIPLRSAEQGKNVPMYRTNLPCRPAGRLKGNIVVSMKPIPAMQISRHVEITSQFRHAHGGPICIGRPDILGIDLNNPPEWGDHVNVLPDEIPVFHACGVTPQTVLMDSQVPFAITHAAGHMFVTDRRADLSD